MTRAVGEIDAEQDVDLERRETVDEDGLADEVRRVAQLGRANDRGGRDEKIVGGSG